MKIVILGGTGLIGTQVVQILRGQGHDVLAASPASDVNSVTGEGLDDALTGAEVVVDLTNSPSFADDDVMSFFTASTTHLLAGEQAAGVGKHVALSIVGAERNADSGYLRAKVAQERLIRDSGVPFTIVRATQFFEFMAAIANGSESGGEVRVTSATLQPIAAVDVAAAVAAAVVAPAINGLADHAGPDRIPLSELVGRVLKHDGDPRTVTADDMAPYFGEVITDTSLVPIGDFQQGAVSFDEWLARR